MGLLPRLAGVLSACLVPSTLIAGQIVLSDGPGWRVNATLGAFAPPIIDGDVGLQITTMARSTSMQDAKDMLDFTISGRAEAWHGNFGLIADANHLGYSVPSRVSIGHIGTDGTLESTEQWADLRAAYRVAKGELSNNVAVALDVQGGLRWNNMDTIYVADILPGMPFPASERWVEPMIGARFSFQLSDRWSGFAAADRSTGSRSRGDRQWSTSIALSTQLSERTHFTLGWRRYKLSVESETGATNVQYNVRKSGPFFGLTYQFL